MGRLILISSVSASGKTTLVNNVMEKFSLLKLKTCTTRKVRPEENGDEYYYLTHDEFNAKLSRGEFAEHSEVYTNLYGLEISEIDNNRSRNCVIIADVQGKEKLTKLYPEIITIFIAPPPEDIILERLRSRNTSEDDVANRIKEYHSEMKHINSFHYVIPYDTLDVMNNYMESIIRFVVMN